MYLRQYAVTQSSYIIEHVCGGIFYGRLFFLRKVSGFLYSSNKAFPLQTKIIILFLFMYSKLILHYIHLFYFLNVYNYYILQISYIDRYIVFNEKFNNLLKKKHNFIFYYYIYWLMNVNQKKEEDHSVGVHVLLYIGIPFILIVCEFYIY